jgi:hypothetical protein
MARIWPASAGSRIVLIGIVLLTCLGAAVLVIDSQDASADAGASFSVFESSAVPSDTLPEAALKNPLVADLALPDTARRTVSDGRNTVYVMRAKDDQMCRILVMAGTPEPTVAAGCGPLAAFASSEPPGPMLYAETESSPQIAVGFLPDGFVEASAGAQRGKVIDNTYLLTVPTTVKSVSVTKQSGGADVFAAPRP